MSTTTLYVAGPMTGLPEHNFPAFNAAEERLVAAGYLVLNPARHGADQPGQTWADYMRRDITDLMKVDGVALLPSWEQSRGAQLEVLISGALEIPVRPVPAWAQEAWLRP